MEGGGDGEDVVVGVVVDGAGEGGGGAGDFGVGEGGGGAADVVGVAVGAIEDGGVEGLGYGGDGGAVDVVGYKGVVAVGCLDVGGREDEALDGRCAC